MDIKIIVLVVSLVCFNYAAEVRQKHPDVGLNVKQLIEKYGYPFENHTVVTEDGYILEIHRISHGRDSAEPNNKVAFLMPGVLCSSADWVNMGPENSLGFLLADRGYDVWLGNYRGTRWSKKHLTLDPKKDKKEFWTFSFQQIGYYDVPASIDHILAVTKQEKVFYIAHSQGTSSFFAMAAARPEYNQKIRLMSGLAPVMFPEHSKGPLLPILKNNLKNIEEFVDKYKYYEVLPYTPLQTIFGQIFCNDDSPVQDLCALVFYLISGFSPSHMNKTMIPVIASNTPAGSSAVQFIHYLQEIVAKKFQYFDYGEEKNLIEYGQTTPPEYDVSKITAPVALYYSDSDFLSSDIDVEHAAAVLSNVVELNLVKGFNHLDFLWAFDVVPLLYDRLLEVMEEY